MTTLVRRAPALLALAAVLTAAAGCSVKRLAVNSLADSLAASGGTFASDEDPELIRSAVPFSLKLIESLLVEVPQHRGLLLTACSSFTQYAYAFIDLDAEYAKLDSYTRYATLQERARKMYLRGRDYCLRDLELEHPGIGETLRRDPDAAVAAMNRKDVPLLYWTAASWGKVVALSLDRPSLAGGLPAVRAIASRALALDEAYNMGAIHEIMITLESLPEAMGGSPARARHHFERAVALTGGNSAGPYLSYALGVLAPQQKRDEFVGMLNEAIAVDADKQPNLRLANLLAQQHARYLLDHLDELFLAEP